jgi:hypothetical protein
LANLLEVSMSNLRGQLQTQRRRFLAYLHCAAVGFVVLASSAMAAEESAVVLGRVMSDAGEFLPDVRIRIWLWSPKGDDPDTRTMPAFETTTDHEGRYKIAVHIGGVETRRAYATARKPGFGPVDRSDHLSFTKWNSPLLKPGQPVGVSFVLRPSLYVAGQVVDGQGKPVAAAEITSRPAGSLGLLEATISGNDGHFELFEFPPPLHDNGVDRQVTIRCIHAGLLRTDTSDVYRMSAAGRANLRIIMPKGHIVSGRLVDEADLPIAKAMVEAVFDDPEQRQAVMSDDKGHFKLTGLADGKVILRAHSLDFSRKGKLDLKLDKDQPDAVLRLQGVRLKSTPKTYDLLGLNVADNSPELSEFFDLPDQLGVVVVGRGERGSLFGPKIQVGDCLQFAGSWVRFAHNLRELVAQMLGEVDRQQLKPGETCSCPISLRARPLDRWLTEDNDTLRLDQESIEKLRNLLAKLRGG